LKIFEEEYDESMRWMKMLQEFKNDTYEEINRLHKEDNEVLSKLVASIKTVRKKWSIQYLKN
jgi:hypothetical protein